MPESSPIPKIMNQLKSEVPTPNAPMAVALAPPHRQKIDQSHRHEADIGGYHGKSQSQERAHHAFITSVYRGIADPFLNVNNIPHEVEAS